MADLKFVRMIRDDLYVKSVKDPKYVNITIYEHTVKTVTDLRYVLMINENINAETVLDPVFASIKNRNLTVHNAELGHLFVKRPYAAPLEIQNMVNTVVGATCLCFQTILLYAITRQKNSL